MIGLAPLQRRLLAIAFLGVLLGPSSVGEAATFRGLGLDAGPLVSGDGAVVAGNLTDAKAFRWTESSGIRHLEGPSGKAVGIRGLSHDGSVIVGGLSTDNVPDGNYTFQPARWTDDTGWQYLFRTATDDLAKDVSADGSIIVGDFRNPSAPGRIAYRWSAAAGLTHLLVDFAQTWGVSDDGSVVVGDNFTAPSGGSVWRWTAETGAVDLGVPAELNLRLYAQPVISADGRVIAGRADEIVDGVCCPRSAFRWTQETGMVAIPLVPGLPYHKFIPSAISGDGTVVLAQDVIWDPANGTRCWRTCSSKNTVSPRTW